MTKHEKFIKEFCKMRGLKENDPLLNLLVPSDIAEETGRAFRKIREQEKKRKLIYAIRYRDVILNKKFETANEADRWAYWNYKGSIDYSIFRVV